MLYQETEKGETRRLWLSACLFMLLLIDPGWIAPEGNGALLCILIRLGLMAAAVWLHRAVFAAAWAGVCAGRPGREALTALAAALPLGYGLWQTAAFACALAEEGTLLPQKAPFAAAAGVLTLSAAERVLEARLLARLAAPLLPPARPTAETACLLRDGAGQTVPAAQLHENDLFLVRPGEAVPADGVVCQGVSAVDESALTGADGPVSKYPGSPVSAGTLNREGALTCRVTRVGADTNAARIDALRRRQAAEAGQDAPAAARQAYFVPAVLAVAAATLAVWLGLGQGIGTALMHAAAVLAAASPAAFLLAGPAALLAGRSCGARYGIFFRQAGSVQGLAAADAVLLDKNGTVTAGEPTVAEIVGTRKVPAKFLLGMAAGLELRSGHPLARAVLKRAEEEKIAYSRLTAFEQVPGQGLRAKLAGKVLAGGSRAFIAAQCELPPDLLEAAARLEKQGITVLWFSLAGHAAGIIGVADEVKSNSRPAIEQLRALGLEVRLLTDDAPDGAARLASLAGLEAQDVLPGVAGGEKAERVRRLQAEKQVIWAGSGLDDAEAMACAGVGVALPAGSLPETAGVWLLRRELADLPAAIRLARRITAVRRRALCGAAAGNLAALLLAAGVLAPLGLAPGPAAAAGIRLLGLAVPLYAGRLLAYKPDTPAPEGGPQ